MTFLYQQQELRRRALAWAIRIKVNPVAVRVEPMKDKWGCCTSDGEVIFADDLVEMDEPFQDYVIVHELLHLRLPTHNRRFKALMSAYVPDWRERDARVRETTSSRHRRADAGTALNHAAAAPPPPRR